MLEGVLKYAQSVASNIEKINEINVRKSTGRMINANKKQLRQSKLTTDKKITPVYAPSTKKKKGFSNPNLYDKGDWQNAIFVDVNINKSELIFNSTDHKTHDLKEKYSTDILGNTKSDSETIFEDDIYKKDNEYIANTANRFL